MTLSSVTKMLGKNRITVKSVKVVRARWGVYILGAILDFINSPWVRTSWELNLGP